MGDRVCAVCGRPVDGLEEAREVGGQWFCSQGHFLAYEARPRRGSPRGREIGGVLVGLVLLAALAWAIHPLGGGRPIDAAVPPGFHAQVDRKSMADRYSAARFGQCLFNHGIPEGTHSPSENTRFHSFPAGMKAYVYAEVEIIATATRFSDLTAYFFDSATLARQGAHRLAALDIYNQGQSKTDKEFDAALKQIGGGLPKPNLSRANKLETVFGNTVVIWSYPHEHLAASNRILDACLAASA